jgi:hypothetical protein
VSTADERRKQWREEERAWARALQPHPYAELFPLLEGRAFEELKADIREHGQREPIIIHNEKILDGRNRWRARAAADKALAQLEAKTSAA